MTTTIDDPVTESVQCLKYDLMPVFVTEKEHTSCCVSAVSHASLWFCRFPVSEHEDI